MLTAVGGGVTVVDGCCWLVFSEMGRHLFKRPQLVLGQRLQGEYIEASGVLMGLKPFQNRQVVNQCFPTGRRRGHDDIFLPPNFVYCPALMPIQSPNSGSTEGLLDCRRVLGD